MYYISKFCRICVQPEAKLIDLNTEDFDKVKLCEKLEACTKMVVSKESLSTEICLDCLSKLRTSYHFLDMCKKSTKKLHGYYKNLLSKEEVECELNNFVNTNLYVEVTPIRTDNFYKGREVCEENEIRSVREKRRRITKEQRCSLLKRLLTCPDKSNREWDILSQQYNSSSNNNNVESFLGGLKHIINFTNNYEFGGILDKNSNYETTHLDKLKAFSVDFFRKDFSEFKNTILYIIENKDNLCDSGDSEEEDFFNNRQEAVDSKENVVKFEEVIIEPDIKIKTELEYEEDECSLDNIHYMESIECKEEIKKEHDNQHVSNSSDTSVINYSEYPVEPSLTIEKASSMVSLNNFVGNYQHKRTFSASNVRCRTRENPYINPLLKQQFLYRSFRCEKCNRYFKSPGYLKAHYSKVH